MRTGYTESGDAVPAADEATATAASISATTAVPAAGASQRPPATAESSSWGTDG
tara:strand:- start:812 stop:973 length:162 start_codon:yes stop_codon:yes gene_type:complete